MDALVVSAAGLLGSNVTAAASGRDWSVAGTYHSTRPPFEIPLRQLDVRDREAFRDVLDDHDPDVVVNCAAMTDVDECENRPDANARAPDEFAAICRDREVAFAHVSTDYVFDGTTEEPYDETASPDPIQAYGESKLRGERGVRDAHPDALVVRLSVVWGVDRTTNTLAGFPAWVRDRLRTGETTPLFTDQHVTPSRAGAVADTLLDLSVSGHAGLYHAASRSCLTPYDFGTMLCDRLHADETLIRPGQQADLDRPASRPQHTCLDVAKVEQALERPQPTLAADLDAVSSLLYGSD
ncbi:MAG: NAD(P)-dependent oxidoreductase [Halapricum sp.]